MPIQLCRFVPILLVISAWTLATQTTAADRPNIVWITSEDHGPHMGAYGFEYADTPNVDALAKKGMIFGTCWSNAPVCAPARTTIITGMYPPSTGSEHMRSMTNLPEGIQMFPQLLREAGYYCTNNSKEDYNLKSPGKVWDESSNKASWKNRPQGSPFFAVFNATASHESQMRNKSGAPKHDPAKVPLPSYHPDLPEVRKEWAHYHDNITVVDAIAGKHLKDLDDAGLTDETIVFYYGDHGGGMPRSKRTPLNSGLSVPMVVYFPEKWKHLAPPGYGSVKSSPQLVSFVDLAPTVLSIAGIAPPKTMQGVAFAGKYQQPPRKYLFGFRGRMDERYDLVRSVTDGRFVYLKNYMPHLPHGQHVNYQFQTKTTQLWKELYDSGKATAAQSRFWQKREPEELYDLRSDPDEVVNLADDPIFAEKLTELRQANRDNILAIRDVGFLPEDEIHTRSQDSSPYEVGHDPQKYPLDRILAMAEAASSLQPEDTPKLVDGLNDADSAVRYWAALGFLMRPAPATTEHQAALAKQLEDAQPCARLAAAAALAEHATGDTQTAALNTLVKLANPRENSQYVAGMTLNIIDNLGAKAEPIYDDLRKLSRTAEGKERGSEKVPILFDHILGPAGK